MSISNKTTAIMRVIERFYKGHILIDKKTKHILIGDFET